MTAVTLANRPDIAAYLSNNNMKMNRLPKLLGLSMTLIRDRLEAGHTIPSLIANPNQQRRKPDWSSVPGLAEFLNDCGKQSMSSVCKSFGINSRTAKSRMEKGWDIFEALIHPVDDRKRYHRYSPKPKLNPQVPAKAPSGRTLTCLPDDHPIRVARAKSQNRTRVASILAPTYRRNRRLTCIDPAAV